MAAVEGSLIENVDEIVDLSRDQFFAGPRLTFDQDREVSRDHAFDPLAEAEDTGARFDQRRGAVRRANPGPCSISTRSVASCAPIGRSTRRSSDGRREGKPHTPFCVFDLMKRLPLLLAVLALAAPAAAQQRGAASRAGYFATPWAPQQPTIRVGIDQDGVVAAASAFLGRPADRGGLQLEAVLHGDRWMQLPLVLHVDYYKGRGRMLYFTLGPALVIDLREKDGQRASAGLSAGGGYEHRWFVLDGRYTSGKNALAITAGVRFH